MSKHEVRGSLAGDLSYCSFGDGIDSRDSTPPRWSARPRWGRKMFDLRAGLRRLLLLADVTPHDLPFCRVLDEQTVRRALTRTAALGGAHRRPPTPPPAAPRAAADSGDCRGRRRRGEETVRAARPAKKRPRRRRSRRRQGDQPLSRRRRRARQRRRRGRRAEATAAAAPMHAGGCRHPPTPRTPTPTTRRRRRRWWPTRRWPTPRWRRARWRRRRRRACARGGSGRRRAATRRGVAYRSRPKHHRVCCANFGAIRRTCAIQPDGPPATSTGTRASASTASATVSYNGKYTNGTDAAICYARHVDALGVGGDPTREFRALEPARIGDLAGEAAAEWPPPPWRRARAPTSVPRPCGKGGVWRRRRGAVDLRDER